MLNVNEFHQVNRRRRDNWRSATDGREVRRLGEDHVLSVAFASNELGGECGELQNKVKKYLRGQMHLRGGQEKTANEQRREIGEEIADVIICASLLAMEFELDLEEILVHKFNKTSEKLGLPDVLSSKPSTMLGEIALEMVLLAGQLRARIANKENETRREIATQYVEKFLTLANRMEATIESDEKSFEDAHVVSFVWDGAFTMQLSNGRTFIARVPGVAPRSIDRVPYAVSEEHAT